MGKIIGLDFGTTNSILSYFDEHKKTIESYQYGGAAAEAYIPSFLAKEKDSKKTYIGTGAKSKQRDQYDIFSNFKMLLSENDSSRLSDYGYKDILPKDIAKEYIQKLIATYKEEKKVEKIDSMVVTIPDCWIINDANSRAVLLEILRELKLPLKELVSEPVAAAGYFIDKYKIQNQKNYDGHLLVFDYGGGTLDISFLSASSNNLQVIDRTVCKNDESVHIGYAGVAYDESVIQNVTKIAKNDELYHEYLIDFERDKIANSETIQDKIINYIESEGEGDRSIFKLDRRYEIKPSDLIKAFEPFEKYIKEKLQMAVKWIESEGLDIASKDRQNFKVLMVGGFSKFYLCQKTVKNFFKSKSEDDPRFNHSLELKDTALAISLGATLIAKNLVNVIKTYPVTISLITYDWNNINKEIKLPIFNRGEKRVSKTIWFSHPNEEKRKFTRITDVRFVFHYDFGNTLEFKEELESNITIPNECNIGFSIDDFDIIRIHILDEKTKNETSHNIGNLIDKHVNKLIMKN